MLFLCSSFSFFIYFVSLLFLYILFLFITLFCFRSCCALVIDSETAHRLEVVSSLNPTGGPSLFSALNSCQTAAGKRLLRSNILEPMTDSECIGQRLDAVEELASRPTDLHQPIKVPLPVAIAAASSQRR